MTNRERYNRLVEAKRELVKAQERYRAVVDEVLSDWATEITKETLEGVEHARNA